MKESEFDELRLQLSENIKRFRKAKGFAQERLGLEAGVDRTLVSKIERQIANPTLEILAKLAGQLDVTVVDLLSPTRPAKCER